jgi:hypothetical protein
MGFVTEGGRELPSRVQDTRDTPLRRLSSARHDSSLDSVGQNAPEPGVPVSAFNSSI